MQFLFTCGIATAALAQKDKELGVESFIYVGTQTTDKSDAKGIYLFKMRTSDDPNIPEFVTVTPLGVAAETENPTYFEIDAKRHLLFCVNEVDNFGGAKTGAVSAYSIDPTTGKLTLLNQQPSMGAGPCHLTLDHTGKYLLVVNCKSHSIAALPVEADGHLDNAKESLHTGLDSRLLNDPYPRGIAISPDNHFVFACDHGNNTIYTCQFDAGSGKLTWHSASDKSPKPGFGPRRIVFHPEGHVAYVLNETDSTVITYSYDAKDGALKELQTVSTLPSYYDGPNKTGEIAVYANGKYLLVSNCGHNSVVLFSIDPKTGTLTYVEDQATYGKMPRHFGIDAAGKHAVVANFESDSILILRSPENGRVKPGGNVVKTPSPTCARFLAK